MVLTEDGWMKVHGMSRKENLWVETLMELMEKGSNCEND